MRRPIIRRGINAQIGTMKLLRAKERQLEVTREYLDIALDYGLDKLAYRSAKKIVTLVREINERGGNSASIFHI